MIYERYKVTAITIAGGELVTGNLIREGDKMYIKTPSVCTRSSRDCSISENFVSFFAHRIDPATIEPVRVTPELRSGAYGGYYCPNCGAWFYAVSEEQIKHHRFENTTPFCGNCGQALDWGNNTNAP